jgi:hypothetical protein
LGPGPHSLQVLLRRLCLHIWEPPHSLHWYRCLLCSHNWEPPQSLHRYLSRLCGHFFRYCFRFGCWPAFTSAFCRFRAGSAGCSESLVEARLFVCSTAIAAMSISIDEPPGPSRSTIVCIFTAGMRPSLPKTEPFTSSCFVSKAEPLILLCLLSRSNPDRRPCQRRPFRPYSQANDR